jgi:acyl-CoA thioester hydrolase
MAGIEIPVHRTTFRVRYAETDAMRIAYHANYLVWYELGRTELLRARGLSYQEIENRGFILPVIESGLQFRESALYDDLLTIETTMTRSSRATLRMSYRIFRGEQLLNQGFTKHCFLERESRKLRAIPEFFLNHFSWR